MIQHPDPGRKDKGDAWAVDTCSFPAIVSSWEVTVPGLGTLHPPCNLPPCFCRPASIETVLRWGCVAARAVEILLVSLCHCAALFSCPLAPEMGEGTMWLLMVSGKDGFCTRITWSCRQTVLLHGWRIPKRSSRLWISAWQAMRADLHLSTTTLKRSRSGT